MNTKISILSRILLIAASALLVVSIFQPIWQIQLDAPQYPEGLVLKIYANALGGDVDIINGLNHYIGMKTLHANDFIEFSILRYIIGFYAVLALAAAVIGRKKVLYTVFGLFVLFGVVAMADFWRWEYNYGHDLNPNAAIIVPGMAYQPPLIGFKQLLNFGAYSIPDVGGWLFVGSGVLMLGGVLKEYWSTKKEKQHAKHHAPHKHAHAAILMIAIAGAVLSSCGPSGPQPIDLNNDNCDFCKMSISDKRFACEMLTAKGRVYKFDDITCMIHYKNENKDKSEHASFFVSDFISPNALMATDKLTLLKAESIEGPMGGTVAAFSRADSANVYKNKLSAEIVSWQSISE